MKKRNLLLISVFLFLLAIIIGIRATTLQVSEQVIINLTAPTNPVIYNETQNSTGYEIFNVTFSAPGNKTVYIRIPKNSRVLGATLNVSGFYKFYGCFDCAYDPGTGPDCTCPTSGLSPTELSTLNTTGSCPGGCSVCTYTPSCPDCDCTSPYRGGGVKSCYACSYTPSCPSCSCPSPGSGGGVDKYKNVYYCSGSWSASKSGTVAPNVVSHDIPNPSGAVKDSCTVELEYAEAILDATGSTPAGYGCKIDASMTGKAYVNVRGVQRWSYSLTCAGSGASCIDCSFVDVTRWTGDPSTSCRGTRHGICEMSWSGHTESCDLGDHIAVGVTFESRTLDEVAAFDSNCNLYSMAGCYVDLETEFYVRGSASWSYHITKYESSKCPSSPCASGDTLDDCSSSCYSCDPCYYTPSPPSCSCSSPYTGGGCKSCYSCSYTPPSPDCTCPSPVGGGSCPGGCEVCGYTPDLPDCSCAYPYTGGGVNYDQPENPWIDVANSGYPWEWNFTGGFNETVGSKKVDLNVTLINQFLSTCTPDENGNCYLPIKLHSDHKGKIQISAINITYELNATPHITLDTNSGKFYWNQTRNVMAGERYKKIYKVTILSPNDLTIAGYYLLNQSATDCWVNEVHYTPTGDPLYCPVEITIPRNQAVQHNISDMPLSIPITKEEEQRVQDMSKTTFAGGYAYSVIPINVTNIPDTGETFYNITVRLSQCPSGWTCDRYQWVVSELPEGYSNVTNATMHKYNAIISNETLIQLVNQTGQRIRWNLTDIWKNNDTIGYIYVNKTYNLPSDCQDVRVYINHTDYTNSPLVSIDNCQVNITWNRTIGPGEELDPEIIYTTGEIAVTEGPFTPRTCKEWGVVGIHNCVYNCPDCYAEVGYKVPWKKSVTLNNTGDTSYTNIEVNATLPPNSIESLDDIILVHPSGAEWNISEANLTEGWIKWVVDEIEPHEVQVWMIYFKTLPPVVESVEETYAPANEWRMYINISNPTPYVTYENVWSYTNVSSTIDLRLYDTTYGGAIFVSENSEWGPPKPEDTNNDGLYDIYRWVTPSLNRSLFIKGTLGRPVVCEVVSKTILNEPLIAGENIKWRWKVKCYNPNDISFRVDYRLRVPLEASNAFLDNVPVELGFFTTPPYGPYVLIPLSLDANETQYHTVEFITPPVTLEVSPPKYPEKFWVGEKARLVLEITLRNWVSENISSVEKKVSIRYGENVAVYEEGRLIDKKASIRGYYTLTARNIAPYETRKYTIIYETPVAEMTSHNYMRKIINSTQYLYYPISIKSLAPFPVDPLWLRLRIPFPCDKVKFVWQTDEMQFKNPREPYRLLDFACRSKTLEIHLSPFSGPGEEEFIDIFFEEVKPAYPEVTVIFYSFIEKIINMVKAFIDWLISLIA